MTSRLLLAHQVISSAFGELEADVADTTNNLWVKMAEAVEPQSEEEALALLCMLRDAMSSAFEFKLTVAAAKWNRERFPRFPDPREDVQNGRP